MIFIVDYFCKKEIFKKILIRGQSFYVLSFLFSLSFLALGGRKVIREGNITNIIVKKLLTVIYKKKYKRVGWKSQRPGLNYNDLKCTYTDIQMKKAD